MGTLDHAMMGISDPDPLRLRRSSPQQEHHAVRQGIDTIQDGVGEPLPAALPMGVRLTRAHSQHGVQQQHALPRPTLQAACAAGGIPRSSRSSFVDVRRGSGQKAHVGTHREAQSVSVAGVGYGSCPSNTTFTGHGVACSA